MTHSYIYEFKSIVFFVCVLFEHVKHLYVYRLYISVNNVDKGTKVGTQKNNRYKGVKENS